MESVAFNVQIMNSKGQILKLYGSVKLVLTLQWFMIRAPQLNGSVYARMVGPKLEIFV